MINRSRVIQSHSIYLIMSKYYIKTFGCQQNKSDSERIAGDYEARGYTEAKSFKSADEIIINTCAVRQRVEDRAKGFLNNIVKYFRRAKKRRPKIILTGCMTHHGDKKILTLLPAVDEILPINEVGFNQAVIRRDKTHAWVPISTGCNSFCTYCIVPYSRGREQSRPLNDILEEVKDLAKNGYTEITLLGMNVNSWGLEKVGIGLRKRLLNLDRPLTTKDIPTNQSQYSQPDGTPPFVNLLQQISAINEIQVIRFLSSNPWDFHDELINEIAKNKKIDRYVHIAVQSGSNNVLKRMNRGYTREDFINLVQKLRKADPNIIIGTDIIVGFPGESEKDFLQTVDLAKQLDFKVAFVAQYSPRPGTAAYRLYPDDISPQTKKKRWQILDDLINKKNLNVRPKIV